MGCDGCVAVPRVLVEAGESCVAEKVTKVMTLATGGELLAGLAFVVCKAGGKFVTLVGFVCKCLVCCLLCVFKLV